MVSKGTSEQALETKERNYELVLIISPEVLDENFEAKVDSVSRFITEGHGTISSVEHWGKRRLAYPIEHFAEGSYVLIKCSFGPALCPELEASLQISEDILRYLLIKLDS